MLWSGGLRSPSVFDIIFALLNPDEGYGRGRLSVKKAIFVPEPQSFIAILFGGLLGLLAQVLRDR